MGGCAFSLGRHTENGLYLLLEDVMRPLRDGVERKLDFLVYVCLE